MAARSETAGPLLSQLLADTLAVPAELDREVRGLAIDSRALRSGEVFFARSGARHDGTRFVADARAGGAAAVVVRGAPGITLRDGVVEARVGNVDACLGRAASRLHGRVAERLRLIGVTGTNGKTSVCHFAARALDTDAGTGGCGVIGTLGRGRPGRLRDAGLTTPDTLTTYDALAGLHAAGCTRVAMEVSSHALDQERLAGLRFSSAVFTNLSRDHLDYHGDMDAYGAAKARLFALPALETVVINRDDPFGQTLIERLAPDLRLITFGGGRAPNGRGLHLRGRVVRATPAALEVLVDGPWGSALLRPRLVGGFNAGNLLAALGVLLAEGLDGDTAIERLGAARAVPGRMEPFGGRDGRPLVVVDYAHTPDALDKALAAVRAQSSGSLWCVFGCGGERDRGKRAPMAAHAARHADHVVITDDNPRAEDGDRIVAEVLAGLPAGVDAVVERDREAAIRHALARAGRADAVLVAGKGHETYQETAGVRRPFSDAAVVLAALGEEPS